MKEITIKYWGHHGRQEERSYQCDDYRIDMSMRAAKRVDLSELEKCQDLRSVNLSNNMLEELDLEPLSDNLSLNELMLDSNYLQILDLWPLAGCVNLQTLNLTNNRIHGLDLTPVFLKAHLHLDTFVVINADYILRFVMTRKELEKRFRLYRPDRAPWTATPVIIWNKYEMLFTPYYANFSSKPLQWSDIRDRIDTILGQVSEEQWFPIQRGLMMGLSLDELQGYDGDPRNLLEGTSGKMGFEQARQTIFENAIGLIEEQVENGGSTLFLGIDAMKTTRASKLIPKIVEARKREIEKVLVLTKGSKAIIDSLWLSHYGFMILDVLNIRSTNQFGDELILLQDRFDKLGFELQTKEVNEIVYHEDYDPIVASQSLKNYVREIASGEYDYQEPLRLPSSKP